MSEAYSDEGKNILRTYNKRTKTHVEIFLIAAIYLVNKINNK